MPTIPDDGVKAVEPLALVANNQRWKRFLSDAIGRENMMLLMFALEAVALLGLAIAGRNPVGFVVFAALIFLFWGEIFVIFPAICGDSFGVENATANNGLLYTAKGVSALAVPLASLLAGLLAKFALVPMRRRLRNR